MIDPHVHLRDWEQAQKERIDHGFAAAAKVGINSLFEMPNTQPALTTAKLIHKRIADATASLQRLDLGGAFPNPIPGGIQTADGSFVLYGLYGGITSDANQLSALIETYHTLYPVVIGFKLFAGHSTGHMGIPGREQQQRIYEQLSAAGYKGLLAVHCEKEALMHPDRWDLANPSSHSRARPPEAELESVRDQLEAASQTGFAGTLHICHVSLPESIELVEAYRASHGLRVTTGATPHHALLSAEEGWKAGMYAKMNPPLREAARQKQLYHMLLEDRIDWIESDHAPHTAEDKAAGASGIPGFTGYGKLVLSLLADGVSTAQMAELTGGRFARIAGLPAEALQLPGREQLQSGLRALERMYPTDVWPLL
ncbi:MAG: dihydroorotase [Spirochaetota bacterium]